MWFFGRYRLVYMKNGQHSSLPRRWMVRAQKHVRAIEPLLHSTIDFGRGAGVDRRVHSGQVGCVRLRRSHVLRGMLKGVRIDGQSMHPGISVISELSRENFVEQGLASLATLSDRRSTLRAARGDCVECAEVIEFRRCSGLGN